MIRHPSNRFQHDTPFPGHRRHEETRQCTRGFHLSQATVTVLSTPTEGSRRRRAGTETIHTRTGRHTDPSSGTQRVVSLFLDGPLGQRKTDGVRPRTRSSAHGYVYLCVSVGILDRGRTSDNVDVWKVYLGTREGLSTTLESPSFRKFHWEVNSGLSFGIHKRKEKN